MRACPYCAEPIREEAIKCRYCGSDVAVEPPAGQPDRVEPVPSTEPESEAAEEPDTPEEPETAEEPDTPEEPEAAEEHEPGTGVRDVLARRWLTPVLAALVLLAAVGVGLTTWRSGTGDGTGGAGLDEETRTQILVSAADLTQRTLSYDHESLEEDMELAKAKMTTSFQREYDDTMSQVRANTEKNKISLEAVASAAAIIEASDRTAAVLVFTNQTTSAEGQGEQVNLSALRVTLRRDGGDWLISGLTALG